METWIFKLIYYPIFITLGMVSAGVLIFMLKEVGWDVPLRWLCLIALLAYAADYYVNR